MYIRDEKCSQEMTEVLALYVLHMGKRRESGVFASDDGYLPESSIPSQGELFSARRCKIRTNPPTSDISSYLAI